MPGPEECPDRKTSAQRPGENQFWQMLEKRGLFLAKEGNRVKGKNIRNSVAKSFRKGGF
jgi:hypothetical protein